MVSSGLAQHLSQTKLSRAVRSGHICCLKLEALRSSKKPVYTYSTNLTLERVELFEYIRVESLYDTIEKKICGHRIFLTLEFKLKL